MPGPIEDPLAPQCGNCKFWDHMPKHPAGNVGECTGCPPTPILIGARPRQFGSGVDMQIELVRPVMATNARHCALHQRAIIMDLGAAKGPVSRLDS